MKNARQILREIGYNGQNLDHMTDEQRKIINEIGYPEERLATMSDDDCERELHEIYKTT